VPQCAGSDPHVRDGAALRCRNGRKQLGNEGLKISEAIGRGTQNNDCDRESGKILLKGKISIDGNEHIKLLRGQG